MHAPLDLLDVLFPLTFGSMVAVWEGRCELVYWGISYCREQRVVGGALTN